MHTIQFQQLESTKPIACEMWNIMIRELIKLIDYRKIN